jgi:hypothetical protein
MCAAARSDRTFVRLLRLAADAALWAAHRSGRPYFHRLRLPVDAAIRAAVFLLVAVASGACAHDPAPCTVAVLPPAAAPAIRTECRTLPPEAVSASLPSGTYSLAPGARAAFVDRLAEAEKRFYGDEIDRGQAEMAQLFEQVQRQPDLLPTSPDARARAYATLLASLRVQWGANPDLGRELARWLAVHMPDQQPSVRQLPPALEAVASDAIAAASRGTVPVAAARPAAAVTVTCRVFVDGRDLGELPLAGVAVPAGRHAVWSECGASASWVRIVDVAAPGALPTGDPAVESLLRLGDSDLGLVPGGEPEAVDELARRLAPTLRADGVVLADLGYQRLVLGTNYRAFDLKEPVVEPSSLGPGTDWYLVGGLGLVAASGALLAVALWANAEHEDAIAETNTSYVDRRPEAADWESLSIGGYAGAAGALAAATTLLMMDVFSNDPSPAPLW